MENEVFDVATEFAKYPAGRYLSDGPYSGQRLRDEYLVPRLKSRDKKVTVDLSGTRGLGSSFLDEAFGGLVRQSGFSSDELSDLLEVIVRLDIHRILIWRYIDAANAKQAKKPKR